MLLELDDAVAEDVEEIVCVMVRVALSVTTVVLE